MAHVLSTRARVVVSVLVARADCLAPWHASIGKLVGLVCIGSGPTYSQMLVMDSLELHES